LVHRDRSASPGGSEGDARFGPFLMRAGANPCAAGNRPAAKRMCAGCSTVSGAGRPSNCMREAGTLDNMCAAVSAIGPGMRRRTFWRRNRRRSRPRRNCRGNSCRTRFDPGRRPCRPLTANTPQSPPLLRTCALRSPPGARRGNVRLLHGIFKSEIGPARCSAATGRLPIGLSCRARATPRSQLTAPAPRLPRARGGGRCGM
jgi:hypothetical protein